MVCLSAVVVLGSVLYYLLVQREEINKNDTNTTQISDVDSSAEQTLHLIKSRRSITPKDCNGCVVSKDALNTILEAANWAPTHKKTEPWRFVILSGAKAITRYMDFLDSFYTRRADNLTEKELAFFRQKLQSANKWTEKCSHVALILMKRQAKPDVRLPEWEEMCAVASSVQNMHLMATSLNVGMYWNSHTWCKRARDSKEMNEYLGMDMEDKMLGALTMGMVDKDRVFSSTRRPILEKVQFRTE
jgi:nitroreductase